MSSKKKATKKPVKKKQTVKEVQIPSNLWDVPPKKSTLPKAIKMIPAVLISAAAAYTVAVYDKEEKTIPVPVTVEQPAGPEKLHILNPGTIPEAGMPEMGIPEMSNEPEMATLAPDPQEEVKPPITVPENEKIDMTKVTKPRVVQPKKSTLQKLDDIEKTFSSNGGLTRGGMLDSMKDE